jgi:hypothetical protein
VLRPPMNQCMSCGFDAVIVARQHAAHEHEAGFFRTSIARCRVDECHRAGAHVKAGMAEHFRQRDGTSNRPRIQSAAALSASVGKRARASLDVDIP